MTETKPVVAPSVNWKAITPGWLLLYEESFLHSLCLTLPDKPNCINIGAGAGTSACALMRAGGYVISIDPDPSMLDKENESVFAQGLRQDQIFQVRNTSVEAAKGFRPESADLIFIDGLHSFEGVTNDLALYTPKLKPGGVLVCHDYKDPRQRSVTKAIKEWMKSNNDWLVIGQVLYMIAFRKPGGDESWRNGRV